MRIAGKGRSGSTALDLIPHFHQRQIIDFEASSTGESPRAGRNIEEHGGVAA